MSAPKKKATPPQTTQKHTGSSTKRSRTKEEVIADYYKRQAHQKMLIKQGL